MFYSSCNTHAEKWLSRRFTTAEQMAAAQTIHNRCVRDLGPIGLEVGSHTLTLLLEHKPPGFLPRHLATSRVRCHLEDTDTMLYCCSNNRKIHRPWVVCLRWLLLNKPVGTSRSWHAYYLGPPSLVRNNNANQEIGYISLSLTATSARVCGELKHPALWPPHISRFHRQFQTAFIR